MRYYLADALGSITALADELGVVKTIYSYDPFGHVDASGEASDNPFQFVGKENDGTGLLREGYRYYSFDLQRYISEDPIRLTGADVNYYTRVGNNPLNFVDPWGLMELPKNPSGLGPEWTPDPTHKYPNGQRFRDPSGRPLDWHPGRPGDPGWGGRDHWHDPKNFGDKHLPPGTKIPDPVKPPVIPWWKRIPIRIPGPLPVIILPPEWECIVNPVTCQCGDPA